MGGAHPLAPEVEKAVHIELGAWSPQEWLDRYLNHSQRIVCLFTDTVVIKFGCPDHPYSGWQNVQEYSIWNMLDKSDRKYFAPVHERGDLGEWLLMEKVERHVDTSVDVDQLRRIYTVAKSYGVDEDDLRAENLGYMADGRLVILDYGYSPNISDAFWRQCIRGTCGKCTYCKLWPMIVRTP